MDDPILDVPDAENVCRLCLSTEEPITSVFADRPSTVSLATKIQASLSIEIQTGDKLSTLICAKCSKRVDEWHAYREACLKSQEKLQKCSRLPTETIPNIKTEPVDVEDPIDVLETVLTSDEEWEDLPDLPVNASISNMMSEAPRNGVLRDGSNVKQEPRGGSGICGHDDDEEDEDDDDDDENCANNDIESVGSRELLFNPMATAGNKDDRTTIISDPTAKLFNPKKPPATKKKTRRGPTTHYRGTKKYRKRCPYCQIYLHSKNSYAKHMNRFHSVTKIDVKPKPNRKLTMNVSNHDHDVDDENDDFDDADIDVETEEMIEDVEDELISLEKDAPLTPVQQNIISQLKTFSCYSCQQTFQDRRSTLNHIRQHMPDLRPYTCIACLTEFADRSIYKLHCGASFQCAMKIALVVPEHGTEKYFTCNMCLRPMSNRKELLSHLSKHSDKQYEQLLAEPYLGPPKLKPMGPLPSPSVSPSRINRLGTKTTAVIPTTIGSKRHPIVYKNDDNLHNKCPYCGMIYRWKKNLTKHAEHCKRMSPDSRECHRCFKCGATFLEIRRFYSHLYSIHKTRDIPCFNCNRRFRDLDEYAVHCRQHRYSNERSSVSPLKRRNDELNERSQNWQPLNVKMEKIQRNDRTLENFSCALCPDSVFTTRNLLAEHRKIHLKLNVYSCGICRRTFGRATALEAHMAHHELEIPSSAFDGNATLPIVERTNVGANVSMNSDPGTSNTECQTCGKVFANYPNLRRHIRTVHDAIGRYSCFTCAKTFTSEEQWAVHVDNEHKDMDPSINCPQCPEKFNDNDALESHRRNVHGLNGEDHLACYICGKKFVNESSLRIHRGHHFRVNSRLSIGNNRQQSQNYDDKNRYDVSTTNERETVEIAMNRGDDEKMKNSSFVRSPRARKSFPNACPVKQLENILQCQVCDDRFADVTILRKHLWDVHCARNKPEKPSTMDKLQCELCTNVMPDEESMASHMKWHETNPILSNGRKTENPVSCDLCGKFYSSRANLRKHKKRHKIETTANAKMQNLLTKKVWNPTGFTCNYCRKVFATRSTLKKHKAAAHTNKDSRVQQQNSNVAAKRSTTVVNRDEHIIKPVRPKLDFDELLDHPEFTRAAIANAKKPVTCTLCRRLVPSMRALYRHRQVVHKITVGKSTTKPETEIMSSMNARNEKMMNDDSRCPDCGKIFPSTTRMRQHYAKVHRTNETAFRCSIDGCRLTFKTPIIRDNHEKTHANVMYTCSLCQCHRLNQASMNEHIMTAHKRNYSASHNKAALCTKINLDNYTVKGAIGRQCPVCKIIYPNFKSMKVHYLKIHECA